MFSVTQEDFLWPRLVPLREKASQPPLRTGHRVFCHNPDVDRSCICKQENSQDYTQRTNKHEQMEEKDDSVLMSREKFMSLNENSGERRLEGNGKLKSVYQVDFASNDVTYDRLMKEARASDRNQESMCTKFSAYVDPFPFKKRIDEKPLFC
ncbi:uncharacterized protein LOC103317413 [Nasonia vitripennis]|uniref:Uncharacterized protein n=1 Tax=Nasonia vitripennis TaxID=7425 RepID=A0A7M7HEC7_NASVI|nr:uncharacterized protein LOC103317413 [Nasonia vitripennis]